MLSKFINKIVKEEEERRLVISNSLQRVIDSVVVREKEHIKAMEASQWIQDIIDVIPIMLWVVNKDDKVILSNNRYKKCKLCIEKPEKATDKSFIRYDIIDGKPYVVEIWGTSIDNGTVYTGVDISENVQAIKSVLSHVGSRVKCGLANADLCSSIPEDLKVYTEKYREVLDE